MSDIGIGNLVGGDAKRDAIHIAVAPMTATTELRPGQHIGLVDSERAATSEHPIGIVDPFLTKNVRPGERFYLFLYPGSITSLRHEWIHPAFVGAAFVPESVSHKWIEQFAVKLDQTYNRLMEAARLWVDCEELTYDNSETYKHVPSKDWSEFWKHYQVVTGTKVKDPNARFFTCSC
jgi:hypothetical protein